MAYRVTAPFVNLKVKDPVTGAYTVQGLYEGAIVQEDVEPDNLKHHLDQDPPMVEEVDAPAPAAERESSDKPAAKSRHT